VNVSEGQRVAAGQVLVTVATVDIDLLIRRARADRELALSQLQLLQAGSRREDIRQAEAQLAAADSDRAAAASELSAASNDEARFQQLLQARAGSAKQHDDAVARRDQAQARVKAADDKARAAVAALDRLKAGARPEEIDAARARVAAADAQIATLEQSVSDATLKSPVSGVVTQKLVDVGEILVPRAAVVVITDLDHAWANVYVDEPAVPGLRLGQPATVFTDAGGPGIPGTVTFISPKAEFTPRNVQTAEERSKLVYRIKVTVDNRKGILKQGMPVEAELGLQTAK
jgi:HlyD family secretion protein